MVHPFLELWAQALTNPAKLFKKQVKKASFNEGAKSMIFAGLIAGLVSGIFAFTTGSLASAGAMAGLTGSLGGALNFVFFVLLVVLTPIAAVFAWLIFGTIMYVFARLLKGEGDFNKQVYLMSLYMAPVFIITTVLSAVPGTVGLILTNLVGLYALFPLTHALKTAHKYSMQNAVLTWFIPILILVIFNLVAGFALFQFTGIGF